MFSEDRAEFKRRDGQLTTILEIIVSADANLEVRRVTLANGGGKLREIKLTSFAEIVLAQPGADDAHPAFSKMFVETEHRPEVGAIIATRRRRSHEDPEVCVAHFAIVEGRAIAVASFETDRGTFIGRGRDIADAAAIANPGSLSNLSARRWIRSSPCVSACLGRRWEASASPSGPSSPPPTTSFWRLSMPALTPTLSIVPESTPRRRRR